MTIFSKNFSGGMPPLAPPGYAYVWIRHCVVLLTHVPDYFTILSPQFLLS